MGRPSMLLLCVVLGVACTSGGARDDRAPDDADVVPAPPSLPALVGLPAPTRAQPSLPPSPPGSAPRARFFVASETTEQVWVLEGEPLAVAAKIPVGKLPHNISVSPDGRWVAVANRMGGSVSVIDPRERKEVVRVGVGKQPHDLIWSPDARTLFVGSEREPFISRIEAGTWIPFTPLRVAAPQHTLAIWRERPNELWHTVTNSNVIPHLHVVDLASGKATPVQAFDVHDIYFTPDGGELWSSSSGFIGKPSPRILIHDPLTKKVKEEIRLAGRYPFHTMKHNRDALFFVEQTQTMVLSDHLGEALLIMDWRQRRIVGEAKLRQPGVRVAGSHGNQPFHTAYTPGRYYVTSNMDNSLRVIDAATLTILHRVEIPRPHGVVLVPLD